MNILSEVVPSIIRGKAVKETVKGFKAGTKEAIKGFKRQGLPRIVRGIKSKLAKVKALPSALYRGGELIKATRQLGVTKTQAFHLLSEQLGKDLAKASKTALSKDAAERLAEKLIMGVRESRKSRGNEKVKKMLKEILKEARANETWKQLAARKAKGTVNLGKRASNYVGGLLRGGAENIAIDKSISLAEKALAAGIGGVATGATTAAIINRTNKKK